MALKFQPQSLKTDNVLDVVLQDVGDGLLVASLRVLPNGRGEPVTFRLYTEHVAGSFETVPIQFQLVPHAVVKIAVEHGAHRREVKVPVKAAGPNEWYVVSGTVVSYEPVELSAVFDELLTQPFVVAVRFHFRRFDGALEYVSAKRLDAVGKHVAKGGVERRGLDVEESDSLPRVRLVVAGDVVEPVMPVLAAEAGA